MIKKDKYNIDKSLVKASFDICFLKYQNMIFHVLNRLGFIISESPNKTNSIECMMDKSHILSIVFNNDKNINLDYWIGSNRILPKINPNTLYILNYDTYSYLYNNENHIFYSTTNNCNCYISYIHSELNINILSIIYNGNKYELVNNIKDNVYFELILVLICFLNNLDYDCNTIIKAISTYVDK